MTNDLFLRAQDAPQPCVGKTVTLELVQTRPVERADSTGENAGLELDDFQDLVKKPRVDARQKLDFIEAHAAPEGFGNVENAFRAGLAQFTLEQGLGIQVGVLLQRQLVEAIQAHLQAAQGLLQRFLEGAADRHRLADRLHLGRQSTTGGRELFERETRDLRNNVIDGRFE